MTDSPDAVVTVVSGLPRSGTSLMMQMLDAGGLPALRDEIRTADEDNPRGYYEFERVKQVKSDKAWLEDARGKVVKMIHALITDLPDGYRYRVIFMRRDLDEILASQTKMLTRHGKSGAALAPDKLKGVYLQQIQRVMSWMGERPHFEVLEVSYNDLVADPEGEAAKIASFLGGRVDAEKMVGAVDPELYRNRQKQG